MKKNILILFLFTFTTISFAQWKIKGNGNRTTQERGVEAYENIKISGSYVVTIIEGDTGNISISADENLLEYIETKVKEGTLFISDKKGYSLRYKEKIKITLTATILEKVILSGSGRVNADHKLEGEEMKFFVSGSGKINLNINASIIETKVTGSGKINLNINASIIETKVTGSGKINLKGKTNEAHFNVSGSGGYRWN